MANATAQPSIWRLAVVVFALFASAFLVAVITSRGRHDREHVSSGVAAGLAVFTYFGLAEPYLFDWRPSAFLVFGLLTVIVVGVLVGIWSSRRTWITDALYWGLWAMVAGPFLVGLFSTPAAHASSTPPDVVVIVVDGYPSASTTADLIGFDNEPFFSRAEQAGFRVQRNAISTYSLTVVSLPSILEMRPVLGVGVHAAADVRKVNYPRMQGDNAFVRLMKDAGYSYTHLESSWSGTRCGPAVDQCFRAPFLDETIWYFASRTPFGPIFRQWFGHSNLHASLRQLDRLSTLELSAHGPDLVFAHILLPHPPLLLDSSCRLRYRRPLAFTFSGSPNAPQELVSLRRAALQDQLACLNSRLIEVFDNDYMANAVVLVLGDHGTDSLGQIVTAAEDWTNAMIYERMTTILMMKGCGDSPPKLAVNALAEVLSCAVGRRHTPQVMSAYIVDAAGGHPLITVIPVTAQMEGR